MKKTLTLLFASIIAVSTLKLSAQEWNTKVDIYSSYLWRGTKFGSGPAMQPSVEFSNGGLAIGAWGSYCFSTDEAMEADLYASYSLNLGNSNTLSFVLTDYYFPNAKWLNSNSHFIEPMITLELGKFAFTAAYMDGKGVSDTYIEAKLNVGKAEIFAGAGDGAYTYDGKFSLCNMGISTSKEIKISESISIPVLGSVILNPSTEQFHIVVGFSL